MEDGAYHLKIYDVTGRQIVDQNGEVNAQVLRLSNVSELTPGIYFYQLQTEHQTLVGKWINP